MKRKLSRTWWLCMIVILPAALLFPCLSTDAQDGGNYEEAGDDSSVEGQAEAVKHQARVLIDSYETESVVIAGEAFSMDLTFLNTNKKTAVYNAKISAECETTDVLFDRNSFYVEQAGGGTTFQIQLTGMVAEDCEVKNARILFHISYEDKDGEALQEEESIILRIKQPVHVENGVLQIPETVYAAETIPVSLQVMNMSRRAIYNTRVEIAADGLVPEGTMFIGNMEAGTTETGEVHVFTSRLEEGGSKYGETKGTYTLMYEDEYGEEYTDSYEFSTVIQEPEIMTPVFPAEEQQTQSQWWISILFAAAILCLLISALLIRKVLNKRSAEHETI